MTPSDIIKSYQVEYDKEYKVKLPQVVTTEIDLTGDGCDGTMMRRVRLTDKETMMRDGYDEHERKTYESYNTTIQPRKFYSETQVENFMKYIKLSLDEEAHKLAMLSDGEMF
jgi:hypothetical protein